MHDHKTEMAVKLLRIKASASDKQDFLAEAELMLSLDDPNIVKVIFLALVFVFTSQGISKVLGVCLKRKPWLLLVEYMLHKDLGVVLKRCKKGSISIRVSELLTFSAQVAKGCAYLEKVNLLSM